MKVKYDKETDILYIKLSEEKIEESDQDKKGFILDYSKSGNLVGIEILNASKSSLNPTKVEYEVA
ncbi:MAG: hypothetical protein COS42_00960 [Flavobacteriales bacterium CG03_land_8_20_14_0_80_35_15]|nr:DUF2283 domain-containing protein [Flavobacteriia bacterium]PIR12957.1 MAG: hypothetical protein COV50_07115 [Flavobacteriales bacterium CG11_big_fil_rev_8_21_14_0_20_35_7]PIV19003.1 MAG: hypothetical protein COS42_00960 [Flavobacteriales bacterium CG03_land_8_20_14_0_80_35_15]PIX06551.1 MAG: hypothetical protein COZ76_08230 [Flavobacteriales bacterium CG_4_8_14_3_um_filter_35_10]PJA05089.1 MAG: hypothetical protein COX71_08535 [Flavobacteriales bacterium CG_4_10_14_0_2_um_filter_35_18]